MALFGHIIDTSYEYYKNGSACVFASDGESLNVYTQGQEYRNYYESTKTLFTYDENNILTETSKIKDHDR